MTVINGLPVKNKMKNVFLENHVFTRFNLEIGNRKESKKARMWIKILVLSC